MKLPIQVNDLKNKVAVITGAGGVLCSMMAKALASAGAKVALLDRSDKAQQFADEIKAVLCGRFEKRNARRLPCRNIEGLRQVRYFN